MNRQRYRRTPSYRHMACPRAASPALGAAPADGPPPTVDGYLGAVRALYGFVAPMEQRLGDEAASRAARTPLLLADIRTLDAGALAEPPLASDLPELATPAARIGARWVLDGSAHGGRAMLPHLQRTLAVHPDHGASYFASAGIDLAAERKSFRDLLERCPHRGRPRGGDRSRGLDLFGAGTLAGPCPRTFTSILSLRLSDCRFSTMTRQPSRSRRHAASPAETAAAIRRGDRRALAAPSP